MGNGDTPITQVYMPPRAAILRLVEAGVVRGLDAARLDALRAECWDGDEEQMEEAGVLGILTSFYETARQGAARRLSVARRSLLDGDARRRRRGGRHAARRSPALSVRCASTRRSRRRAASARRCRRSSSSATTACARPSKRAPSTTSSPASTRSCARAGGSGASSRSTPPTAGRCTWRSSCAWRASSRPRARCRSPRSTSLRD